MIYSTYDMKKITWILFGCAVIGILFFMYRGRIQHIQDIPALPQEQSDGGQTVSGPGYTLRLPDGFVEEENGEWSRLYFKKSDEPGAGPTDMIYVSVVPVGVVIGEGEIYNYSAKVTDTLRRLKQDEQVVVSEGIPDLTQYYTYTRTGDRMLGGYGAQAYVNEKPWEFPEGTVERRYLVFFAQATYLVGSYSGADTVSPYFLTDSEIENIISTITFSPETVFARPNVQNSDDWKTYDNRTWGLTFRYPSAWQVGDGGQNFQNGDLFSLTHIGQTQRPQTELYDGVSFAVMLPVTTDEELADWMKRTYGMQSELAPDRPPQYSEKTIGANRYETVSVCGLGCFTYYHLQSGGEVYGFMVMAEGPDAHVYQQDAEKILASVIIGR